MVTATSNLVTRLFMDRLTLGILQKSCNKQAEQWKTTVDLLCLNQEEGHAEAGKMKLRTGRIAATGMTYC